MCFFRELNMYWLLLSHLDFDNWKDDGWKAYAVKALGYLRMLSVEVQAQNQEEYHYKVSCLYEAMGNDHKARLHREQALAYSSDTGYPVEVKDIINILNEYQGNPQTQLDICMYILGFITIDGIWRGNEYYDSWQREQYELVENIVKHDVLQYVENEAGRTLFALYLSCLKGIYYKRTRRFLLAERYFSEAIEISSTLPDEDCLVTPLMLYTLLGQMYLSMNDMEKADSCFKKALAMDTWDLEVFTPFLQSYYGEPVAGEEWEALDNEYVRAFFAISQEDITFSSSVKQVIDGFFAPPEVYEEEESEEENEKKQGEAQDEQEYTFDSWYELAESGDIKAQLIVGYCYYTGTAVTQNHRLAREWFYLAALQEDAIAQQNLQFMYERGYGGEVNKEEAEKWRWKATHEGTWRPNLMDFALTKEKFAL